MKTLDFDSPQLTATLYGNMGLYYKTKKEYNKTLYYFKKSQIIMEKNYYLKSLSFLYKDISDIFEQQNNLDSALFYARKNQEIVTKLRSNIAAIETYQQYITTLVDAQKNELIIADQKIKLRNRQIFIIVILLLAAILLFLVFYEQKRRKNSELTAEINVQKLEKEKQEEVLNAKTRELASYSILVSNKNHLLKQVMELSNQTFNNKDAKQIYRIINDNLNIDEEWDNFKLHFDKVHPNFFEKLKNKCNDLTEENLKMCAYIKIGMSNKQIAQLLHIEYNSVVVSKLRIKNKLKLDDEKESENETECKDVKEKKEKSLSDFIGKI